MLSQDKIDEINSKCPSDQGIFREPTYIPVHIKELVVYTRYETGGYSGGSCWNDEDSHAEPYECDEPKNKWDVLDILLKELCPNVSYLQYKEITKLIHTNEETEGEYYGNSTDWRVEYIVLPELLGLLETF